MIPRVCPRGRMYAKLSSDVLVQVVIVFVTGLAMATALSQPAKKAPSLRIVQINDVYALDALPHLATLIQKQRDSLDSCNSLAVVCAGDFLAPSLLSSLDGGKGMVDVLNAVGCTHVCLGNHETDVSSHSLANRIRQSNFVWVNSNLPDLNEKLGLQETEEKTVPYCILPVGEDGNRKSVAFLGLLTEDPSLYRPTAFAGATLRPVNEVTTELLQELEHEVDLIVPLTHQSMEPTDRDFARTFGTHFPLLLGGHDHEIFDETINACQIIKTGMDAEQAAVIDISWENATTVATITSQIVITRDYAPDPAIEARVKSHQAILQELEKARLFNISDWISPPRFPAFSTKNNRIGPSSGTQAFCSMIRMGSRCQVALLNAGCVRAAEDYDVHEYFTWSDLKAEMPFPTPITVCSMPGRVLEETIAYSRRMSGNKVAFGGYIHTSRSVVMSEENDGNFHKIESIMGTPFDPDRNYLTALPIDFFHGIDNHKPLLEWAKRDTNPANVLQDDSAIPAKLIMVEVFSALIWLHFGSFEELSNGDGKVTREDVRKRMMEIGGTEAVADLMVDNVFAVADIDNTGSISALEQMMVQFVATDMLDHVVTSEEMGVLKNVAARVLDRSHSDLTEIVEQLHESLDTNNTGSIQREEIARVLGAVQNRDMLS